jgi:hypothetical protein
MPLTVQPEIAPLYDVTFVLCGMVYCCRCRAEAPVDARSPVYSDENYYAQAVAMTALGWVRPAKELDVICPRCAGNPSHCVDYRK